MIDDRDRPGRDEGSAAEAPTICCPDTAAPTIAAGVAAGVPGGGDVAVSDEIPGRYLLKGEHARGGQARVLLAFDTHTGRDVAWKELLPEWFEGGVGSTAMDGISLRFLREARITARLEHPNICPVHEIGRRDDGRCYYTMRLVRGETLAQKLAGCETLAQRQALLGAFWDVCHAMAFAHDQGIIHRDLKPGNIMVGEFGETVVLDWGLAKVRGADDARNTGLAPPRDDGGGAAAPGMSGSGGETVDGAAMGTPWYMSPEQARGAVDEMDECSDVWGLGAVLYEILSGRPPFDGPNVASVISQVLADEVRPVREICEDAPPELAGIARKCLQRDKNARYASARELAADVTAFMTGDRVRAHSYSSWELLKRFAARNRPALVAAGAILAVIVAALVAVSLAWRAEAASRERERAAYLESEYSLARAHVQQATRLVGERRLLAARVHALASLLHNPAHPGSVSADPSFRGGDPAADRPRMEALSVVYRTALRHVRGLERTLRAPGAVRGAALSPDARLLATGDQDGWLTVWDAREGAELYRRRLFEHWAVALAFSPDGSRIAAAGTASAIRLLDTATGSPLLEIPVDATVKALTWSPDGGSIVSGHGSGEVRLWDAADGAAVEVEVPAHTDEVRWLAFSPDGGSLATGSWDRLVRVIDLASGRARFEIEVPGDGVYAGAFSPDGRRLVTGAYDGAVRLWDAASGAPIRAMTDSRSAVISVAFSRDGRRLLSGGLDRNLRLWDAEDGDLLMAVEGHTDAIYAVGFIADDKVFSASQDGTIRLWLVAAKDGIARLHHPSGVYATAWSPDGRTVATGGWDHAVRLWDAASGTELRALEGHEDGIVALAFSPDGALVASGDHDRKIRLWDVAGGEAIRILEGHEAQVLKLAFSPDGALLASASADRRARLWDALSGEALAVLDDHGGFVYGVAFSPDGRLLATASFDHKVRIFDVASRRLERTLEGHSDSVSEVRFSPDGRLLLSTSKDRTAVLWDTATWRELHRLEGHKQWINRAGFTPDGRRAVTGGDDGYAFLWDLESGNPLLRIDPGSVVADVAVDPGGRVVALGCTGVAVLFPLDLPEAGGDVAAELARAEALAGGALDGFELAVKNR